MSKYVFDTEYDLVVVGSGGSGKMAAYIAKKEGDLSVALLEKMERTGGSSVYAEGQAAFNSIEQKERKTPPMETGTAFDHYPTYKEGYDRYMDYSHQRANPDVVRMQLYNTAETIEIMRGLGIKYTDVMIYAYDQANEINTFHRPDGLGEHMQEVLLRATTNAGVDIFTSTPAKKILMEDGKVVGVEALDAEGNKITIACKAVILASGGYGNNPEMVSRYSAWQHRVAYYTYQCVELQNTGDGLKMALECGADTENLGALMMVPCARGKQLTSHTNAAGSQPILWVNRFGKRCANEEMALSFMNAGACVAKQPDGIVYAILDADTVQYLTEDGSDIGLGDFIEFKQKLTRLQIELDQDVAEGVAWMGDTAEELAEAIGIDPEVLGATVAEYNDSCDKGDDPLFFKNKKYLRPIRKAPFYAINMAPSILVSTGGIRVNGDLQVTDVNYEPIPGLYAVGLEASGLYGDNYNLDVPGTANGFAHASGRVAARHVIKTLKG